MEWDWMTGAKEVARAPLPTRGEVARILVVDDNIVSRTLMVRRLAHHGFEVEQASDGEGALRSVERQAPHLVLLDLVLPGMGGIEVLRLLRKFSSQAELPVIITTARESDEAIIEALKCGANDYVVKGVDFAVVLARLRGQLSLRQALVRLNQAQKLEGIGELASGIAHEINTPIQFVGDNISFLQMAYRRISGLLEMLGALRTSGQVDDAWRQMLQERWKKSRVDYLLKEMPQALEQGQEGIERVATIVRAMKAFAHPGENEGSWVDLESTVQTTLTVSRNAWKHVAQVETDFDPDLGQVMCNVGQINQVFLNLVVNAAHAIESANREDDGRIRVLGKRDGAFAEIRVEDNGCGMPAHIKSRIFDPFFTTKEVGKGTGQGLALVHAVINEHRGTIDVESTEGVGTSVVLRLPIAPTSERLEAVKDRRRKS
jgi:signal transduction histidine kinase